MRHTKIIATVGPASDSESTLDALIDFAAACFQVFRRGRIGPSFGRRIDAHLNHAFGGTRFCGHFPQTRFARWRVEGACAGAHASEDGDEWQ